MIKIKPLDVKSKVPQARSAAGLVQYQKKFIIIGGGNRLEQLNDIWEADVDFKNKTSVWRERTISLSPYSQRTSQAVCSVKNKVFIHGGQNFLENKHYSDMFEYDLDTDSLRKLELKEQGVPEARNSHTLVHDSKNKRLILFGGANEKGPLSDMYSYDLEKHVWEQLPNKYPELSAREMHTCHIYYSDADLLEDAEIEKNSNTAVDTKIVSSSAGDKIIGLELDSGLKSNNNDEKPSMVDKGKQVKVHTVNLEFDESTLEKGDCGGEDDDDEKEPKEEEKREGSQSTKGEDQIEKPGCEEDLDSNEIEYLLVVGGRSVDKISNEIICINLKEKKSAVIKKLPIGLCTHASYLLNDCLYIFGGTEGTKFLDSLFIYDILSGRLLEAMLPKDSIPPLIASSICAEESGGKLIIYGGSTYECENDSFYMIDTNYYSSSKNCKEIKDSKKDSKK